MTKLTEEQREALDGVMWALRHATDTGLLDVLASDIHPDVINVFCDSVTNWYMEQEVKG
jgi:hypothetical protein